MAAVETAGRDTACDVPEENAEELSETTLATSMVGIPLEVAVPCGTNTTKELAAQDDPVFCPIVTLIVVPPCGKDKPVQ
jgi:hypothetical protein